MSKIRLDIRKILIFFTIVFGTIVLKADGGSNFWNPKGCSVSSGGDDACVVIDPSEYSTHEWSYLYDYYNPDKEDSDAVINRLIKKIIDSDYFTTERDQRFLAAFKERLTKTYREYQNKICSPATCKTYKDQIRRTFLHSFYFEGKRTTFLQEVGEKRENAYRDAQNFLQLADTAEFETAGSEEVKEAARKLREKLTGTGKFEEITQRKLPLKSFYAELQALKNAVNKYIKPNYDVNLSNYTEMLKSVIKGDSGNEKVGQELYDKVKSKIDALTAIKDEKNKDEEKKKLVSEIEKLFSNDIYTNNKDILLSELRKTDTVLESMYKEGRITESEYTEIKAKLKEAAEKYADSSSSLKDLKDAYDKVKAAYKSINEKVVAYGRDLLAKLKEAYKEAYNYPELLEELKADGEYDPNNSQLDSSDESAMQYATKERNNFDKWIERIEYLKNRAKEVVAKRQELKDHITEMVKEFETNPGISEEDKAKYREKIEKIKPYGNTDENNNNNNNNSENNTVDVLNEKDNEITEIVEGLKQRNELKKLIEISKNQFNDSNIYDKEYQKDNVEQKEINKQNLSDLKTKTTAAEEKLKSDDLDVRTEYYNLKLALDKALEDEHNKLNAKKAEIEALLTEKDSVLTSEEKEELKKIKDSLEITEKDKKIDTVSVSDIKSRLEKADQKIKEIKDKYDNASNNKLNELIAQLEKLKNDNTYTDTENLTNDQESSIQTLLDEAKALLSSTNEEDKKAMITKLETKISETNKNIEDNKAKSKKALDDYLETIKDRSDLSDEYTAAKEYSNANNHSAKEYREKLEEIKKDKLKKDLQILVDEATNKKQESKYLNADPEKKEAYDQAIEDANNKLNSSSTSDPNEPTIKELEELIKKVEDSKNSLNGKDTDKNELKGLYDESSSVKSTDKYNRSDSDKKKAYNDALDEAKKILDKTGATQAEVDAVKEKLKNAKEALNGTVDKEKLNNLVNESEELKKTPKYTESSESLRTAYDQAIEKAKEIIKKENATQDEVNEAIEAIGRAKDALNGVDKSKLRELYAESETIKSSSRYTNSSEEAQKAYNDVIEEAKKVIENPNATEEQVNSMVQKIEETKKALDEKYSIKEKLKELIEKAKVDEEYVDDTTNIDSEITSSEEMLGDDASTLTALEDKYNEFKKVLDDEKASLYNEFLAKKAELEEELKKNDPSNTENLTETEKTGIETKKNETNSIDANSEMREIREALDKVVQLKKDLLSKVEENKKQPRKDLEDAIEKAKNYPNLTEEIEKAEKVKENGTVKQIKEEIERLKGLIETENRKAKIAEAVEKINKASKDETTNKEELLNDAKRLLEESKTGATEDDNKVIEAAEKVIELFTDKSKYDEANSKVEEIQNIDKNSYDKLKEAIGNLYDMHSVLSKQLIEELDKKSKGLENDYDKVRESLQNLVDSNSNEKASKLLEIANKLSDAIDNKDYTSRRNELENIKDEISNLTNENIYYPEEIKEIYDRLLKTKDLNDSKYMDIIKQLDYIDTSIIERANDSFHIDYRIGGEFTLQKLLHNFSMGVSTKVSDNLRLGTFVEYRNEIMDTYGIGINTSYVKDGHNFASFLRYRLVTNYDVLSNHNADLFIKYAYDVTLDKFIFTSRMGMLLSYSSKTLIEEDVELLDAVKFRLDLGYKASYYGLYVEPILSVLGNTKQTLRQISIQNEKEVKKSQIELVDFNVNLGYEYKKDNQALRLNVETGLRKYIKFGVGISLMKW